LDDNDSTIDRVTAGYDALAAKDEGELGRDESPWGDSHFQQYYSWPATERALPELDGYRVLLAGCGRGDHVDGFRERGATVTGVDASETAVRRARERYGGEATFYRADLTERLDFADDDAFDLVVCHLVLSHVAEWRPVFAEFRRVLADGGALVVATIHPRYVRSGADVERYYETGRVTNEWPGVEIPTYYRPMSEVVAPFVDAGFRLERFDEPEPREAYAERAPERYESAAAEPELIVVRARADR